MSKIAPSGAQGNMRLLKAYGGGSTPPRQAYANGGEVGNPSLDEGLAAAGDMGKSKPGKDGKGKDKKEAKVNINVIVAAKDKDAPAPAPTGAAGLAPPPPMPMPPPAPMAGPPPGPMPGPGMPMRAAGGRVKHDDAKMDKKLIDKEIHKHEAGMHPGKPMTKLAKGGPVKEPTTKGMLAEKGYQGGGGGAVGRLEKTKAYGK